MNRIYRDTEIHGSIHLDRKRIIFTQGHGQEFFEYLTHDKGYARRLTSFGKIINPLGIRTVGEFPNLTETLLKRGHSERVVRKIMGENWVNVLADVWGE